MNKTPCFSPAHILLPSEQIPVGQWGCVACDQFTSDRSYWEKAAQAAAGGPSTLDLILPEVYLEEDDVDARISAIHAAMDDYTRNVLTRAVDGFIYVERTEQSGRCGRALWAGSTWRHTAMPRVRCLPSAPVSTPWKAASRPAWRCAWGQGWKRPIL